MSDLPDDNHSSDPTPSEPDAAEQPICSARGCPLAATWVLLWNNPRIHTPDREKSWLACDAHRDSLADFLDRRGFLRRYEALSERPAG